jgi:hypothetical protein
VPNKPACRFVFKKIFGSDENKGLNQNAIAELIKNLIKMIIRILSVRDLGQQ